MVGVGVLVGVWVGVSVAVGVGVGGIGVTVKVGVAVWRKVSTAVLRDRPRSTRINNPTNMPTLSQIISTGLFTRGFGCLPPATSLAERTGNILANRAINLDPAPL